MWDLPGPGIEPVFPALAGGFVTTVPPGKSHHSSVLYRKNRKEGCPEWSLQLGEQERAAGGGLLGEGGVSSAPPQDPPPLECRPGLLSALPSQMLPQAGTAVGPPHRGVQGAGCGDPLVHSVTGMAPSCLPCRGSPWEDLGPEGLGVGTAGLCLACVLPR